MMRALFLGCALLVAATPLAAQNIVRDDADQVEQRLRVCLSTGAPGAPRESLTAAVTALRSLCFTQIGRVRDQRLQKIDDRLRIPRVGASANQKIERERAHEVARRELDDEIVRAVSSFTGLTPARPAPEPPRESDDPAVRFEGSFR